LYGLTLKEPLSAKTAELNKKDTLRMVKKSFFIHITIGKSQTAIETMTQNA
jgi:hypothetical protein